MSQLKVNEILDSSGGSTAQINGATPTVYNTMGRNRIINGDMRIDQRNAGASVTPSTLYSTYTLDRWVAIYSVGSKFSVQQNAGSVTPPTGFTNYLGVTSLSSYSMTGDEGYIISQMIEGFNVADLGWGTANAKSITISFWVRSSLTGTFSGALSNSAENSSYAFTYTISSANTWEYKTVTIAGDTTGTWVTNNGIGLRLKMTLGASGARAGSAGSWASGNYYGATGATSVVGTSGATFYITGVQLEVGSVATEFERRPYGTELQLCMRYYQTLDNVQIYVSPNYSSWGYFNYQFPVQMRATPTSGQTAVISVDLKGSYTKTQSNISISNETVNNIAGTFNLGAFTSLSLGTINQQSSGGKVTLSSEL